MKRPVSELPRLAAVDAFSAEPLAGNGAAVVLLEEPAAAAWMQALAAELNQSETAFLWRDGLHWRLRWFTPSCEVPLCGHATLAAAIALQHWDELRCGTRVKLHSRSGALEVMVEAPGQASIVLPAGELLPRQAEAWMAHSLPSAPLNQWTSALGYGVVLLPPEADLGSLNPDDPGWASGPEVGWVVMQSAPATHHYQLRFFAPGLGLREDPVTGSAHALVAPWWCQTLQLERVHGWQPSQRPGGLWATPLKSGMIRLQGHGVLLVDGHLQHAPPSIDLESWRRCAPC